LKSGTRTNSRDLLHVPDFPAIFQRAPSPQPSPVEEKEMKYGRVNYWCKLLEGGKIVELTGKSGRW
jgi:hypothetical protein